LQFIIGKLDHLYTILQDKKNMFADTSKLIIALKPYRALLSNYTPAADIKDNYLKINNKCKDYVCMYVCMFIFDSIKVQSIYNMKMRLSRHAQFFTI
jgi:hypothetical protein